MAGRRPGGEQDGSPDRDRCGRPAEAAVAMADPENVRARMQRSEWPHEVPCDSKCGLEAPLTLPLLWKRIASAAGRPPVPRRNPRTSAELAARRRRLVMDRRIRQGPRSAKVEGFPG